MRRIKGLTESRAGLSGILPDLLRPGLLAVFCGTAAGHASAARGAYYAGRGNRFWQILHESGMTAGRALNPDEWRRLDGFGIGLTDLCKSSHGMDAELPSGTFDARRLRKAIEECSPEALAFNGLRAAREFLGRRASPGRQPETVGSAAVWVLPSTSGAARGHWDAGPWLDLALSLGRKPASVGRDGSVDADGEATTMERGPK